MVEITKLKCPEINAADLIDRLKAVYDVRTDRELGRKIGVDDVIFTRWRNRNTFHKEVVFAVANANGVSINHLLFGHSENVLVAELSAAEVETVRAMCKAQGMTEAGVVRFALRLYQEVCERFANGEQIEFSGNGKNPSVFIAPMLSLLRARHKPRKPRPPKR